MDCEIQVFLYHVSKAFPIFPMEFGLAVIIILYCAMVPWSGHIYLPIKGDGHPVIPSGRGRKKGVDIAMGKSIEGWPG